MKHEIFDYLKSIILARKSDLQADGNTVFKTMIMAEAIIYLADAIFSGLRDIAGELRRVAQEINLSK